MQNCQEYWVNVYKDDKYKFIALGHGYNNKDECVRYAGRLGKTILYRIHVKMKEVKPIKNLLDGM